MFIEIHAPHNDPRAGQDADYFDFNIIQDYGQSAETQAEMTDEILEHETDNLKCVKNLLEKVTKAATENGEMTAEHANRKAAILKETEHLKALLYEFIYEFDGETVSDVLDTCQVPF